MKIKTAAFGWTAASLAFGAWDPFAALTYIFFLSIFVPAVYEFGIAGEIGVSPRPIS